jgi:hypothetical protein
MHMIWALIGVGFVLSLDNFRVSIVIGTVPFGFRRAVQRRPAEWPLAHGRGRRLARPIRLTRSSTTWLAGGDTLDGLQRPSHKAEVLRHPIGSSNDKLRSGS